MESALLRLTADEYFIFLRFYCNSLCEAPCSVDDKISIFLLQLEYI